MAITFPIDVPLNQFSEIDVEMVNMNSIQEATFTGRESVQRFNGDYWKLRLRYTDLDRTLAQPVNRFLAALRTSVGTFVVQFPGYSLPNGAARTTPSSPLVDGTDQPGKDTLTFKNGPASVTDWLVEGDIIQVGPGSRPHWHMVLEDVTTSASGGGTMQVWPNVRADVVNNDQIITENPLCLFRMLRAPDNNIRSPIIHRMTIDCRESTG